MLPSYFMSYGVEINLELNPMITGCLIKLFRDNDGENLIAQLEQYLSENE